MSDYGTYAGDNVQDERIAEQATNDPDFNYVVGGNGSIYIIQDNHEVRPATREEVSRFMVRYYQNKEAVQTLSTALRKARGTKVAQRDPQVITAAARTQALQDIENLLHALRDGAKISVDYGSEGYTLNG